MAGKSTKVGYVNGSNLLLYINGKAIGHCTSHSVVANSETKDRSVKPLADKPISSGLWKGKGVTGLSISITGDGLVFYDETETGYAELLKLWRTGGSVGVKCQEREGTAAYLEGQFIISNLELSAPAQDDSTYKISLDNDGEPTKLDEATLLKGSVGAG